MKFGLFDIKVRKFFVPIFANRETLLLCDQIFDIKYTHVLSDLWMVILAEAAQFQVT